MNEEAYAMFCGVAQKGPIAGDLIHELNVETCRINTRWLAPLSSSAGRRRSATEEYNHKRKYQHKLTHTPLHPGLFPLTLTVPFFPSLPLSPRSSRRVPTAIPCT